MASQLNTFKTVTHQVTGTEETVYTTPAGYTGVVLLLQATNANASAGESITARHVRSGVSTLISSNMEIAPSDSLNLLGGKLVLETGDSITVQGGTSLDLVLSILESLNG